MSRTILLLLVICSVICLMTLVESRWIKKGHGRFNAKRRRPHGPRHRPRYRLRLGHGHRPRPGHVHGPRPGHVHGHGPRPGHGPKPGHVHRPRPGHGPRPRPRPCGKHGGWKHRSCGCRYRKIARCTAAGDPHYTTFDGRRYNFMGECQYVLAKHAGTFEVLQKNVRCGNGKVTCTQEITVNVKGLKISVVRGGLVYVDKIRVVPPYNNKGVSISQNGRAVKITVKDVGLTVGFNGVYNVFVEVSSQYNGKLQGLCGNSNCKIGDDFTKKGGQVVGSAAAFGNSWKVEKSCSDATKIPNRCRHGGLARRECSAFKRGPFRRCNRVLNPANYIRNCVYDVCRCKGNGLACLCQAYVAYSEDCAAANNRLKPIELKNYTPLRKCAIRACASAPCLNGGRCGEAPLNKFKCTCPSNYQGEQCEKLLDTEVDCTRGQVDILYVVDGSGSVGINNFNKIRTFLKQLTAKFNIGTDKTHVGLMQFGAVARTYMAFGLGEKNSQIAVDKAIDDMKYLYSLTFTGDALKRAREKVFTKHNGDRPDAADVLILFTDGQANDGNVQLDEAKRLKQSGVKIITVAMGNNAATNSLKVMASVDSSGKPLQFEVDFEKLNDIINALVKDSCSNNSNNTSK